MAFNPIILGSRTRDPRVQPNKPRSRRDKGLTRYRQAEKIVVFSIVSNQCGYRLTVGIPLDLEDAAESEWVRVAALATVHDQSPDELVGVASCICAAYT